MNGLVRRRLRITGVVQGVGFRPFVHRLASELELAGEVGNDSAGVFAEIEGPAAAVAAFELRLVADAPELACIRGVTVTTVDVRGDDAFCIVDSEVVAGPRAYVSPDIAVCDDCLGEMDDPGNARYRYPFINCTNCGPRFTITLRLPYDRPNTTMAGFEMCTDCAREYHDPGDRRFHAQPIACPTCGPRIWFEGPGGLVDGTDDALNAARRALDAGKVVAIKGIGGYHLACDASSDDAVSRLRDRKARPAKPLAVMVATVDEARRLSTVSAEEARLLTSPQRPIVLLRRRPSPDPSRGLSRLIAPGHPMIGLLLPYSPLHHLLLRETGPLVMTSGNLTEEPICYDDGDARARLGRIADGWLVHNRLIHVPCDDSVVRMAGGKELPIRRSRGYVPLPVELPFEVTPTLAVGGELKNTFGVAAGRDAWMSQHVGDMGSIETLAAFERSVEQFEHMYALEPVRTVADLHPAYATRQWAERRGRGARTLVQHHHAHVGSVMAEHQVPPGTPVLGFAFDGTGYGTDGAIWGGEVLLGDYDGFARVAHLHYTPLPGGDSAVRKPYRVALAQLWSSGIGWDEDLAPVRAAGPAERVALERQLERGYACIRSSSMGRLFDAVSSLLDVRHVATYEAEAAVDLEVLAEAHLSDARAYRMTLDPGPLLKAMVGDLRLGVPAGPIAAGFHIAVADLVGDLAAEVAPDRGLIALCGGVWQNVVLLELTTSRLRQAGRTVITHELVPPNDGGLALGQLVVAR